MATAVLQPALAQAQALLQQVLAYAQSSPTAMAVTVAAAAGVVALLGAFAATLALRRREKAAFEADLAAIARLAAERAVDPTAPPLTALVTGANSGIGYTLAVALAKAGVRVVLGCRSSLRGQDALHRLQSAVPGANARLLVMDVCDPKSVVAAGAALRGDRFYLGHDVGAKAALPLRLDYLFCNAGIMPVASYNWGVAIAAFFRASMGLFFETGRCSATSRHFLVQPPDAVGPAGASTLFGTHVLGHWMLVRELAPIMGARYASKGAAALPGGTVVWTSSRAATRQWLNWHHLAPPRLTSYAAEGKVAPAGLTAHTLVRTTSGLEAWRAGGKRHGESYGEAKYLQDLLNAGGLSCFEPTLSSVAICPGYIDTELTPPFFKVLIPLFRRVRAVMPGMNIEGWIGAHASIAAVAGGGTAVFSPACKYVLVGGKLVPAVNGVHPVPAGDVAQAQALMADWLKVWDAEAAAKGRAGLPVLKADAPLLPPGAASSGAGAAPASPSAAAAAAAAAVSPSAASSVKRRKSTTRAH